MRCSEVVSSNRLEVLADHLASRLFGEGTKPFDKRIVIVPHEQVKSFLYHYFARHPHFKVAAGMEILSLPESFLKLFALLQLHKPKRIPSFLELSLQIEDLISALFVQKPNSEFLKPLFAYFDEELSHNRERLGSLSDELSRLFNQYGLYGNDFLEDWLKKEGWQQYLWQKVFCEKLPWTYPLEALYPTNFSSCLGIETVNVTSSFQVHLQVHLFGFSYLPAVYLSFFRQLNSAFYHLSPCALFWEDLSSEKERIYSQRRLVRQGVKPLHIEAFEHYVRNAHPLLANWGKLGREHLKQFDMDEIVSSEEYVEPSGFGVLASVQRGLLFLHDPTSSTDENIDQSIQLHSASSKLREIEIAYDVLCGILDKHRLEESPIVPRDLVVLAPDINAYAPLIQMVFGAEESKLAYSIHGVKTRSKSDYVQGLLHLMNLSKNRFSSEEVLSLFDFSSFAQKWELSKEDVTLIQKWVKLAGIRWGWNRKEQMRSLGCTSQIASFDTWEEGLDRLLWGLVAAGKEDQTEGFSVWPCPAVTLSEIDLLDKFLRIIRSLQEDLKPIYHNVAMSAPEWLSYWEMLSIRYFCCSEENEPLMHDLRQLTEGLKNLTRKSFTFSSMERVLDHLTESHRAVIYPPHLQHVTFASLTSGILLPGRVFWLLGMDETAFPRSERKLSLSEMQTNQYIPQRIEEDRYLFLECLTLAQDYFLMSYERINPQDSKEQGPSLMIQELLQYLESSYQLPPDQITTHHPFLPFDARYFSRDIANSDENLDFMPWISSSEKVWSSKPSSCQLARANANSDGKRQAQKTQVCVRVRYTFQGYSPTHFAAAKSYYGPRQPIQPLITGSFCTPSSRENSTIELRHLATLAKHPIRFYFQETLGMRTRFDEEDTESEFVMSNLLKFTLRKKAMTQSLSSSLGALKTQGKLPLGIFEEVALTRLQEEIEELDRQLEQFEFSKKEIVSIDLSLECQEPIRWREDHWILPALQVPLPDGRFVSLIGRLEHVSSQGLLFDGNDEIEDWIKCWPLFLVYLTCNPLMKREAVLFTKAGKLKESCIENPLLLLSQYLAYYERALKEPSPLMPFWVNSLLFKGEKEFAKSVADSVENDECLFWLKRRQALPNSKEVFNRWKKDLEQLLQPMLTVWSRRKKDATI
jgi:exodeoxyribonuclease V gamma subunit